MLHANLLGKWTELNSSDEIEDMPADYWIDEHMKSHKPIPNRYLKIYIKDKNTFYELHPSQIMVVTRK